MYGSVRGLEVKLLLAYSAAGELISFYSVFGKKISEEILYNILPKLYFHLINSDKNIHAALSLSI